MKKISDALWSTTLVGDRIFLKGSIDSICGYSKEEIQKLSWLKLIHPEDADLFILHKQLSFEKGEFLDINYRIQHKHGHWIWVHDRSYDITDDNGLKRVDGILSDISEQKEAEISLKESEAKYRSLQNNIPDVLYKEDGRGKMSYMSDNIENLLGYTPEEISNTMWAKIVFPDDLQLLREASRQIFEEEKPLDLEYRIYHKDGSLKWLHERAVVILDKVDNLSSYGIMTDITARKELEKKLKVSEDRWSFALESNQDGVWDWNMATNKVFFSYNFKRMLGFEDHEISDDLLEWDKRVHPDDKVKTYNAINDHIQGKSEWYIDEHRVQCKDGTYKWILDRGKVIEWNESRDPTRFIGTHTDITERKLAEREKERMIANLKGALSKVKQLSGFLPICANCKKIRDDSGYYHQIEDYISSHSDAEFSHGLCPKCVIELYPEYVDTPEKNESN